jgi:hypothetical protein
MLENKLSEPNSHFVYAEKQFDLGVFSKFW